MSKLQVAVVIANYGTKNEKHLQTVIAQYLTMERTQADLTVLTGEHLAGAPPHALPFLARHTLAAKLGGAYDLYVFSEDDILITERNLEAWIEATIDLREFPREIPGFLRYEVDSDGKRKFPDMHAAFRWGNVEQRDGAAFAEFSNAVAACYVLTRAQLRAAIDSGGFLVGPHSDSTYGILERGSADIYLQCGLRRLIPLTRFDEFLVRHLPNNYLHMGKPEAQVRAELQAMGVTWR